MGVFPLPPQQRRKRNYIVTGGYERSGVGKGSGEVRERVCREQRQRKGKGAESSVMEITC
ncbi:arylsulfatase [Sesbania bispinosa]|nr:arylsulfatase [Sesbania bispinosa]